MFGNSRKKALSKATKHERWIRKFAAQEARKTAKALAGPGESQDETEETRKLSEKLIYQELSKVTYEKFEIQRRMILALSQRCDKNLAFELVAMIDFKGLDEKRLMPALIGLLQRKDLCRGRDDEVVQQWDAFVEPYRDKSAERRAELEALIEEDRRLKEAAELREQEATQRAQEESQRAQKATQGEQEAIQRAQDEYQRAQELVATNAALVATIEKLKAVRPQSSFITSGYADQGDRKRPADEMDRDEQGEKKSRGGLRSER